MKAMFLVTWRQWLRGGARTWFVAFSALVCSTMLAAVQFGGFSLADSFKMESGFSQVVLAASQLVVALLVVFLAVLLRGAFSMSLAQRTRMLGQLASVGATRRQLRQSVWLDALFLSAFAAPLGILCAAGGLAVTFRLLRPVMDALAARVDVPVIASGGAGKIEDFQELFRHPGIDAGLAASIFHTRQVEIRALKEYLRAQGVEMRL